MFYEFLFKRNKINELTLYIRIDIDARIVQLISSDFGGLFISQHYKVHVLKFQYRAVKDKNNFNAAFPSTL